MSDFAFIGALINNPSFISIAHKRVRPVDLDDRAAMFIYETLIALDLSGEPIDADAVFRKLESLGLAGRTGGGPMLARCSEAFKATGKDAGDVIAATAAEVEAARASRGPQEDVTEEVVLAGMLKNPEAIGSVATTVSEIDFTSPGTSQLFRVITSLVDYGGGEPAAILHSKLLDSPAAAAIPGFERLLERVLELEVDAKSAVEFAAVLRNRSTLQRLDQEVDDLAVGFLRGNTPEEVLKNARRRVMQVLMRPGAVELRLKRTPRKHLRGCECDACTLEARLTVALVGAGDEAIAGLRSSIEAAVLGARIALVRGLTPEEASGVAAALTGVVWWVQELVSEDE